MSAGQFHGLERRRVDLDGATLVETEYAPGAELPLHSHDQPYVCVVVDGTFEERSGGHVSDHVQSDVIFHPKGEPHSDRFRRVGATCFNIEFTSSEVWDPLESYGNRLGRANSYRNDRVSRLGQQLFQEFRHAGDPACSAHRLVMQGLIMTLAGELLRRRETDEQTPPSYLARVMGLLHERYLTGITLGDVAREADVHPTHMTRVFRQHCGCTIGEYLRNLRVEYARELLTDQRTPISQIALEAGFADHSHFTRTFRRHTGHTPSEYREMIYRR